MARAIQGYVQEMAVRQDIALRLRRVTEKVIGLPSLPTLVAQLIVAVEDPDASAQGIARLISADQAFTARVLRIANSAFYGLPRRISTVRLAIVVLGFPAVKNLCLGMAVLRRFSGGKDHPLFDRQRFWEHAIACGVAARMLARKFRCGNVEEALVAGILHDIGKLILIEYFPEEFAEALDLAAADGLTVGDAEAHVLGITHAEVGGWLAEKWALPPSLVDVAAFHHRPGEAGEALRLVQLVHVSNALVRHRGIGNSGDRQGASLDPGVARTFKRGQDLSDEALLDSLSEGLEDELRKAQIFWELAEE